MGVIVDEPHPTFYTSGTCQPARRRGFRSSMVVTRSSRLSATSSDLGLQIDGRGIRPHSPAMAWTENASTPW